MKSNFSKSFQSPFKAQFTSFLEFKRSLGRKYAKVDGILRNLDRFLVRNYPELNELSLPVLERWAVENSHLHPSTKNLQLGIIREFCLYRRRFNPSTFVPDKTNTGSMWPLKVPRFLPYIYSKEEIRKLLITARQLPTTSRYPLRDKTSFMALLLLYATGMRISEVAALRVSDINWLEGTLLIREAKFNKSRLIPLNQEVISHLKEYIKHIRCLPVSPSENIPLFQKGDGQGYTLRGIEDNLRKVLKISGIKRPGKGTPRIHDLRHTFAVHRVADWYETGADVQNLLPRLATYMGHKCLLSTQYSELLTRVILI